ncbi:MAG: hypothetical protein ACI4LX_03945 [Treponema sp.]
MFLKKVPAVFFILLFSALAFCQEEKISQGKPLKEKSSFSVLPYFNTGTQITVNTASKEKSAPSPVSFLIGGGAVINFNNLISLEPKLDFWSMYYLYDGENALPAEVEHRTATVLCFMLDIPVGFNFHLGENTFTAGCGLGFLIRLSLLSNGVKQNDSGATGTAQGDTDEISKWFWSNARFLYPEIFVSWDYRITESLRAGIVAKAYFCIGSLVDGRGLDGTVINIAARFIF